ncbi:MAG TPA: amidohydrolase family protein [Candidatus Acidoferrales bacterium]|nr:amidohydrolase family protein [Candidatus Acidoferrales bacterium]
MPVGSGASSGATLISGGALFDGTGSKARPADLLVVDDRVAEIAPRGAFGGRAVARTIDAKGMTVLPGLIDAHVHVGREPDHDGALYLGAGVTSARDTGGVLDNLLALRARALAGEWNGPRLRICGPLIDSAPTVWPAAMSLVVGTEGDGRAAVDQLADKVDQIKVYSGVGPELVREIVERARAYAIPVTGDLAATRASEAVDAGIAGLEHASVAYADIVPDELQVTMRIFHEQNPAVWRRERNKGQAAADPSGAAARRLARQFADSGVWFDPTLVVLERMSRLDDPAVTAAPEVALMLESTRAFWAERVAGRARSWTEADYATARRAFEVELAFVGETIAAGATILVGSDAPNPFVVPGWSLHRELELLVRAGFTPLQVLTRVTSGNAAALGIDHMVGTLRPGKLADVLIVAGDPLADIRATREVRHVLQGGVVRHDAATPARA